ncbi:MAG: NAD(P)H-hydrate dehydratase [Chloroflexota bacterium]
MPHIVTAQQMKDAEAAANAAGLSYDTMMENAGRAVAEALEMQFGVAGVRVTVLVGPGNNGGDGLVTARYLSDMGATVILYIWKRVNLDDDVNWRRLADYGLATHFFDQDENEDILAECVAESAIIVDALLGTGVSRPIEGGLATLLDAVTTALDDQRDVELPLIVDPLEPPTMPESGPIVVAVDVPSGLYADTGQLDQRTIPAEMTITFAVPKRGHVSWPGAAYTGQLLIADIAVDPEFFPDEVPHLATPLMISELLPDRPPTGHKGTFGKVLVVGGCLNYTGAPSLSATAAYRVGAGLVTVAIPNSIQTIVAANLTEATYLPLADISGAIAPESADTLYHHTMTYSSILVGPGLSQQKPATDFLTKWFTHLIAEAEQNPPLVLDADALNYLAQQPGWWAFIPADSVLTPHPGEMSRLTGLSIPKLEAQRLDIVSEMAQTWKQTIVFKGAYTVIADAYGQTMVMPFANPALSTAGSGDVLAGCIAGFLAQGLSSFDAAVTGAFLHGLAGEMTRDELWEAGVMASDLLPRLPLALKVLGMGNG